MVFSDSMDLNDVGNLHFHLHKQKEAMAYPHFTRGLRNGRSEWAPRASGVSYEGKVEEVPERIEFAILKDHLLRDLISEICCADLSGNEPTVTT